MPAATWSADPQARQVHGEVAEWLNVPDSKSGVRENVPGVRIPPSPPQNKRADSMSAFLLCRIEKREGFEAAAAAGPVDRKSTRLNSSHSCAYRMPSSR